MWLQVLDISQVNVQVEVRLVVRLSYHQLLLVASITLLFVLYLQIQQLSVYMDSLIFK